MPITIRTAPEGDRALLADLRSGAVHVIDLAGGSATTVLDVAPSGPDTTQGAHGIHRRGNRLCPDVER
ncbi:hypothetical protein ACIQVA_36175 [Streptomyces microflavus]|uniref:hypothetical protein n=1 Tax=Streptomyces microflavus TaxID=1919 RepID=UPI00381DF56D